MFWFILTLVLLAINWRVAYSFYKWARFKYQEPEEGQVWAFARLTPGNNKGNWHTFKVILVNDVKVIFESNWIEGEPDMSFATRDEWRNRMKHNRGWILRNDKVS